MVKKKSERAKPPEQSKGLVGNIEKKTLHGIQRAPQCYRIVGQQYNFEETTVILLLLLLLFLTFSVLVANPKKTSLHGGQSRSWSAEQGGGKPIAIRCDGTIIVELYYYYPI